MTTKDLSALYLNVLSDIDISLLDCSRALENNVQNLSGLFLTSEPPNLRLASNRIMIVGCETRGWRVLKKEEKFVDLADYIEKSLTKHKNFFANQLEQKNSKGFAFHNFTRSISAKCGKDGLIYSNLFCLSWNKGSPIGSPHFETIKKYSGALLKVQITHFEPNIIIFANGINSAFYRREIFPIDGNDRICKNGKDYHRTDGVSKHHLWEFELYDKIQCFRIHHPSSRSKEAIKARELLLKLLPSKLENTKATLDAECMG